MEPTRAVIFYSQSKDDDDLEIGLPTWRKELSNFAAAAAPIVIEGRSYPTVEHAFQAAKYLRCATPKVAAHAVATDFEVGGKIKTARAAKSSGGRGGMTKRSCALDIAAWAREADGVMQAALRARAETDARFASVLTATRRQRVQLVHFERSSAKSYWGGSISSDGAIVGRNRLGEMLMELRESIDATEAADTVGAAGPGEGGDHTDAGRDDEGPAIKKLRADAP